MNPGRHRPRTIWQRALFRVIPHPYPLRYLLSKALWRTGLCRRWVIDRGGYKLRFHPCGTAAAYWANPDLNRHDDRFLDAWLHEGDTVVDVGANIGATVLPAALRVGETGRVHAFEPHPVIAGYLRENLVLNGVANVQIHPLALGAAAGELAFTDLADDSLNRLAEAGSLCVPVRRLDDVLGDEGAIALLKVDVEGYEKPVLEGAAGLLDRVECIYFEAWEPLCSRYGYRAAELVALLLDLGYTIWRADGDDLIEVLRDHVADELANLIAVRDPPVALARLVAAGYRAPSSPGGTGATGSPPTPAAPEV